MTDFILNYSIRDYCYSSLGWFGRILSRTFPNTDKHLEAANMKIHSEVYFSLVGAFAFVSLFIPLSITILYFTGVWKGMASLAFNGLILIPGTLLISVVIVILGAVLPATFSSSRMDTLKVEIPYASMYISVMCSGGLSPYESFKRMRHMDLLPNMKDEVEKIETIVMSTGADPISAMEQAAKSVDLKDYNDLLLGYASSVRTGGDTLHYLYMQTHSMFQKLISRVKTNGETMAMMMEAYTIIGVLGVLGLFLMFVVGMGLPTMGMSMSPSQFFLFSFVVTPFLSLVFIFAGDAVQFSYPISNWTPYKIVLAALPIALFLGSQMILPFYGDSFIVLPIMKTFIVSLGEMLNLSKGCEPALGLTLTLFMICIPGYLSDRASAGRDSGIQDGITQFLRDLVEVRKGGLSPEKSIEALSQKDYKGFSKYLKDISTKINWGYPLSQIYEEFAAKVKNWLALINIYLLIDTLEVGGGTEKSIESLAEFAESSQRLEIEKRAVLMPLIIVPYIGAALLTGTTVMFIQFFADSNMGVSVPFVTLYKTLLTPLSLHSFTLGLVTGKITSGRVSAGFKHAIFLCLVSLLGIWAVSNMNMGGGGF